MRTWWIVKTPRNPVVEEAQDGSTFLHIAMLFGVGPFWSYKDAMAMLHFWM